MPLNISSDGTKVLVHPLLGLRNKPESLGLGQRGQKAQAGSKRVGGHTDHDFWKRWFQPFL
jgi:hypothetical protein